MPEEGDARHGNCPMKELELNFKKMMSAEFGIKEEGFEGHNDARTSPPVWDQRHHSAEGSKRRSQAQLQDIDA